MSIYSALQTGVSGLFANATSVARISENIANANTNGYKRSFAQMVTSTASNVGHLAPSGVQAVVGSDIETSGALSLSGSQTDLAVNGEGFFIVSKNPNDPVQTNYMLTRAGAFAPDKDGNLVNAAGYYLAGYRYADDGTLGAVDRNSVTQLQTINTASIDQQAAPTTRMSLAGNLPAQETGQAEPGAPFISSGTFHSALGVADRLQFQWQPGAQDNTWTATVRASDGTEYGSVDVAFTDTGPGTGTPAAYGNVQNLAAAPAAFAFDPATGTATLTVDNGTTPQQIEIAFGAPGETGGLTQFSGDFTPQEITADGSSPGSLLRTEMDERGNMYGVFDNGQRRALFQIPLGLVTNPDGLVRADGNAYRLSRESGDLTINEARTGATGSIEQNMLEASNVEIAQELTDLIRTQRAYSSNAKIITTMDEMLDETTRLKR